MGVDEREWKLWRSGQPFVQPFSVVLDDDDTTMTGSWDRVDNGAAATDTGEPRRNAPQEDRPIRGNTRTTTEAQVADLGLGASVGGGG